ncbi:hypothetical protein [Brevundimonas lenta]|uniref:Lipoprotein n=1 Tax=Brevundimonas lenta TaxID=424796 RepID=A0A7W6JE82_9CAUL|nr:hypothetical protein [Brevundimonas lenta]MBB4082543.1 hypothetical protein [Brevundimonas lenta]
MDRFASLALLVLLSGCRPEAVEVERELAWRARPQWLTLIRPDPSVPPELGGREVVTFHCEGGRLYVEARGLPIGTDVGGGDPADWRSMIVTGGGERAAGPIVRRTSGYETWPATDLRLRKPELVQMLSGETIKVTVVPHFWTGLKHGLGLQSRIAPAPSAAMTGTFLSGCEGPG